MNPSIGAQSAPVNQQNRVELTKSTNAPKTTATEPPQSGKAATSTKEIMHQSTEDQIRERAYYLYLDRGSREGNSVQDWIDAETELLANR